MLSKGQREGVGQRAAMPRHLMRCSWLVAIALMAFVAWLWR